MTARPQQMSDGQDKSDDLIAELAKLMASGAGGAEPDAKPAPRLVTLDGGASCAACRDPHSRHGRARCPFRTAAGGRSSDDTASRSSYSGHGPARAGIARARSACRSGARRVGCRGRSRQARCVRLWRLAAGRGHHARTTGELAGPRGPQARRASACRLSPYRLRRCRRFAPPAPTVTQVAPPPVPVAEPRFEPATPEPVRVAPVVTSRRRLRPSRWLRRRRSSLRVTRSISILALALRRPLGQPAAEHSDDPIADLISADLDAGFDQPVEPAQQQVALRPSLPPQPAPRPLPQPAAQRPLGQAPVPVRRHARAAAPHARTGPDAAGGRFRHRRLPLSATRWKRSRA